MGADITSQWYREVVVTGDVPDAGGIVVAVLDDGIDASHPDLAGSVIAAECAPISGSDVGRGHGTKVAGLLAPVEDNLIGLAPTVTGISILDVPVIATEESGARRAMPEAVAAGIRCAVESGADVINLSIAGSCSDIGVVEAALAHAEAAGVVVVAAAGNLDQTSVPCPGAFDTVISAGAVDEAGDRHGQRTADVVAPGVGLVTTGVVDGGYAIVSGTSFAAPLVSAAVAALVAEHPDWTPSRVRARVHAAVGDGVLDVGSLLSDDHLSYVGVTRDGDVLGLGDTDIAGVANTVSAVDLMVLECGFAVVAADGGVFTFGGAPFLGSLGGLNLAAPIVAAAPTPSGAGYWLFGADGGVFTFGDAGFHGSLGAIDIGVPIVDAAASPTGDGYWMVTADGAVFSFGDAVSLGSIRSTADIVAINAFERGYALTRRDGSTFSLGTTLRSWDTPGTAARSAIVDASGPVVVSGGGEVIRLQDGRRLKTPVGVVAAAPTPATICS